jgi:hypothetical protein
MALNSTGLGLEVAPNSVYSGTNYIVNSFFDSDNDYTVNTFNTSITSASWRFCSPLFTSTGDYKSFSRVYFLRNQFPYNDLGIGATVQKRVIKFAGTSSPLISFNNYGYNDILYPSGFNRQFPDFPMRSITTNTAQDGWSGGFNGNNQPQTPANNDWAKYERYQFISVPDGVNFATFGCMVQVPQGDDLRSLNFAGMYVYSYDSATAQTTADAIAITGSGVPSLISGYFSNGQLVPMLYNARFQWNGFKSDFTNGTFTRWNDFSLVLPIQQEKSTGYRGWRQINKAITLPIGTSRILGVALYFAENHTYLNNDGISSGSILFYNPYVTFY